MAPLAAKWEMLPLQLCAAQHSLASEAGLNHIRLPREQKLLLSKALGKC